MIIFDQTAAGSTGQSTVQQPGIFILSHLTDEEKMMVIYQLVQLLELQVDVFYFYYSFF